MKTRRKKLGALIVASTVMASLLAGCAAKPVAKVDSTKLSQVTLNMYLVGDKPADTDTVFAEVNKKLQTKINTTINLNMISWGDLDTKYPLIFASGEDFDLIYTSSWCKYGEQATKAGFLELTPAMLQKDAPKTWADEPKAAWDQAKVNGKIYMVPQNAIEYNTFCTVYRGDLQAKYGVGDIKTVEDYTKYLDAVAKNEKTMSAVSPQLLNAVLLFQPNEWESVFKDMIQYKITDSALKPFLTYSTPEYLEYAKTVKAWADKKYWSKSIAEDQTPVYDLMAAGKIASLVANAGTSSGDVVNLNKAHPEWKASFVDLTSNSKRYVNSYIANGMAIHATSKNPDRALMALDLLRNDPVIHDLTLLGIKDTHWTAVGDKQFSAGPSSTKYVASALDSWGWNTLINRTSSDTPKIYLDYMADWMKNKTIHTALETYNFNDQNVKNEVAACTNVQLTYDKAIQYGEIEDPAKAVQTFQDKLKTAGIDTIIKEELTQISTAKSAK